MALTNRSFMKKEWYSLRVLLRNKRRGLTTFLIGLLHPEGKKLCERSPSKMRTFSQPLLGLLFFTLTATAQTTEPVMVGNLPGQFDLPADKPKAVVILPVGTHRT